VYVLQSKATCMVGGVATQRKRIKIRYVCEWLSKPTCVREEGKLLGMMMVVQTGERAEIRN